MGVSIECHPIMSDLCPYIEPHSLEKMELRWRFRLLRYCSCSAMRLCVTGASVLRLAPLNRTSRTPESIKAKETSWRLALQP
jgi:hypothetical protein